MAEHFDVHPNQVTAWKAQLEGGASDAFGPGSPATAAPAVDVKSLHAKIGELTLGTTTITTIRSIRFVRQQPTLWDLPYNN